MHYQTEQRQWDQQYEAQIAQLKHWTNLQKMNFLHFQLQLKREKKKSGQSSKKTKKKSFMRSKKKGEISQDETLDKTLDEM